ncbi:hypothetical protein B0H17DRAFT_1203712 [Mycena rosella]|uniref:Uncharacterized protein n=1 Tax=Mycena rosella TaxID=1033263 RepID=A0AAD7GG37_MYCRO|nr:hypothetical protein B0H17DRAFT_1203712 [Mycena rosella]
MTALVLDRADGVEAGIIIVALRGCEPADKFFIPHGGLLRFLHDNLRFKVFVVMSALFTNAYVSTAVPTLTTSQRQEIQYCMRDIVWHMFFAVQIRQNEFHVVYCMIPVPPQSAWTFHVILAMLHVLGFEGDGEVVAAGECPVGGHPTEGKVAARYVRLQRAVQHTVTFNYADYDTDGLVTQFFYRRCRPTEEDYALADLTTTWGHPADTLVGPAWRFEPLTNAEAAVNAVVMAGVVATVAAVEQIQVQLPPPEHAIDSQRVLG